MSETQSRSRQFWKSCQRWSLSLGGQITAILVLLLRLVWGMWQWRDMTSGDTTSYYHNAMMHQQGEPVRLVFSPLYEVFYGWCGALFQDAFVATIVHRIIILALLSLSLLLLARKLLPRAMAWLVAVWWLVLPIDWNALYEVHLFGFLPLVVGCWLVGLRRRGWGLALGLASVWTGALLVRNEYALSVALLTLCCVIHEWLAWRRSSQGVAFLGLRIGWLATPSLLVLGLAAAAWYASWPGWKEVQVAFHDRHTLNMAQVYPFSYQQRHPEWTQDPWLHGDELMKEKFGKRFITFSEAFKKDPGAIWEHVIWHFRLLPAGLQLGLFNGHFGADSPDFTPPLQKPVRAAVLSILVLVVIAAGGFCLWQRRARLKRFLKSRRFWSWLALLCLLPPCFVAIVTQRPRPSYIFPLNFFAMALTGLCLYAILRRLKLWRPFQAALPVFMVIIVVVATPEKTTAQFYVGQPFRKFYERLAPYHDYVKGKRTFASRQFTTDCLQLINLEISKVNVLTLSDEIEQSPEHFQQVLDNKRVTTLYLDAYDLDRQGVKDWLAGEEVKKWKLLSQYDRGDDVWMLLTRSLPSKEKPAPSEAAPPEKGK